MVEPTNYDSKPYIDQISFDPSLSKDHNPSSTSNSSLIRDNPINKSTVQADYWPKNPLARERSLSQAVSLPLYNPRENYMHTEWIARRATFLHHLDDNEKKFDLELLTDMKQWNQEIIDSQWALNDLATPKQWLVCSRKNKPSDLNYGGELHTTEQDLRREWPPLPIHRYRHFKYDDELVCPEDWNETHKRSTMMESKLHPLAKSYHHQSHDLKKEEESFMDNKKNKIKNHHYVANVPRSFFDHYPTTFELQTPLPFKINHEKTTKGLNLWPPKPKIYPNYLEPPPRWRTCERNAITHYLPSSKMKGQELFDAWARYNKHVKENIMWNPNFLQDNNFFFPVVVHINPGDNWLGGYNRGPRDKDCQLPWLSISMINFLPPDVTTVIAGEKGLVVLDGGEYLTLQNQELWEVKWPSQSITMVVNPLVATYQIIPPFEDPKYSQEYKIGRLILEEHPERNKSYYKLYMVGERSGTYLEGGVICSYIGSLISIYDSRSHTYSDVNTFDIRPSPLGVSSLVVMHGHMIWGGIHVVGQRKRITKVNSKQYQPAIRALEFENGIITYNLLHKRFQFLKFAIHREVGDLGDEDKWESPRVLCCYGITYLVTRQMYSKREFKMPTRSNSTFYVYRPRVFRLQNFANPVYIHPLTTMPITIHNHLFGPKQEDYSKCRYDVRGGMGDLCIFSFLRMNFAICTPEIDQWRILETTVNILPGLPTLLRLADCEYIANFRAEPKHQPGESYNAWEGRGESYPKLFRPPPQTLLSSEDHRVRCCHDDPIPYHEGNNLMGLGTLVLKKQLPLTTPGLHFKAMLDVANGHKRSLRRRTIVPLARNSIVATTRKSFRKLSYIPPTIPQDWLSKDNRKKKGPPHPPTQTTNEFNDSQYNPYL